MKFVKINLAVLALTLSCSAHSQEVPAPSERAKGLLTPSHDMGFFVETLPELVEVADIIVQGRYGRKIGTEQFLGYGVTRESLEERFKSKGHIPRSALIGVPLSEYEILVDNVIKGERLASNRLVLRVIESPDADQMPSIMKSREGKHLFFLMLNPDGTTVGLFGAQADMKESGDAYTVTSKTGMSLTTLDSHNKVQFLNDVIRLSEE